MCNVDRTYVNIVKLKKPVCLKWKYHLGNGLKRENMKKEESAEFNTVCVLAEGL